MGTVNFKLEADEAQAVQSFLKVVDAQRKIDAGAKKNTRSTSRFGKSAKKELNTVVGQWTSIGAAIGLAKTGIGMLITEMERLNQINKNGTMSIMAQIAAAGDLAQAGTIRKFLTGAAFKGSGLTYTQGGDLRNVIRGAAPGLAIDRIRNITAQAAGYRRAGISLDDGVGFGQLVGGVAAAYKGKSAEDVVDVAAWIFQQQGKFGKKIDRGGFKALHQWNEARLGTNEQGLGMLMASIHAKQGTAAFQALVDVTSMNRVIPDVKPGRRENAAQQAMRAYYAAPKSKRLAMLRSDPSLRAALLTTRSTSVEAMFAANPAAFARQVTAAQRTNEFSQMQTRAMSHTPYVQYLSDLEKKGVESRRIIRNDEGAGMRRIDYLAAARRARGVNIIPRSILRAGDTFAELVGIETSKTDSNLTKGLKWMGAAAAVPYAGAYASAAYIYGAFTAADAGGQSMSDSVSELRNMANNANAAAANMNAAATNLLHATETIPNPNAHTE